MLRQYRFTIQRLHIHLGLIASIPLLLAAISGSLLVLATPLDQRINGIPHRSQWNEIPPVNDIWMEKVVVSLRAEHGNSARIVLRPPRQTGEPLYVKLISPEWDGDLLYANGEDKPFFQRSSNQGVWNFLFNIHTHLLVNDIGKMILFASSISAVMLFISGLGIRAMRSRNGSSKYKLLSFHRFFGLFIAPFIIIIIATGAYIVWKPMPHWVSSLAGQTITPAPKLRTQQHQHLKIHDYLLAAQQVMPDSKIGFITLPAQDSLNPVLIRKKLDGDVHPNGRSSVWLDPDNAAVIAVRPWHAFDIGSRWHSWSYAFHSAQLWGIGHLIFTFFLGVMLIVLLYTGIKLSRVKRTKH